MLLLRSPLQCNFYYVALNYIYVGWDKMSGGRAPQLGRASSPPPERI